MKYGRRPPKHAPSLSFASFRATVAPAHPVSIDYLLRLSDWQVLGNDTVGDCNSVAWANMRRLVTSNLSTEVYPTQDQVWEFYRTQNPNFDPNGTADTNGPGSSQDQGMEIQTGLEYLHKHGGPDGVKAVAFAQVDHTNQDEVDAAIAIFGGLWLGITVLDANQTEFGDGKEWTLVNNAQIDGGHAVLAGGYTPDVRFVTWGEETGFAPSFWNGSVQGQALVDEAWVVVWPEHLGSRVFLEGVDVAALAADYTALTGGGTLPVPSPVPVPVPVPPLPAPTPSDAADARLAVMAKVWSGQSHWYTGNKRMAAELRVWLTAKGWL